MSFVDRFFKSKKKRQRKDSGKSIEEDAMTLESFDSATGSKTNVPANEDDVGNGRKVSKSWSEVSTTSSMSEMETQRPEQNTKTRQRLVRRLLNNLRREEMKLKRKQKESLALDKEIDHVTTLIAQVKVQHNALNEDILNKKCELKFLQSEVPEDYEAAAKCREPGLYKKYTNVKSAEEAKTLLITVRQKLKAAQYMELLVYDLYIDFKHNLKSNAVQTQSSIMAKNKKRHFGHLTDTVEYKRKARSNKRSRSKVPSSESGTEAALDMLTTVTIESPPIRDLDFSPVESPTTPPFSVSNVQPNTFIPHSVAAVCNPPMETTL